MDCKPGTSCFLQNYVDHDAGSAARDHRCAAQTYDGHKGTDIRLRDRTAMEQGVNVLAAARGTVKGVRDGLPDVSIRNAGTEAIKGRECGNGVVIDHGDGWVTQYCHMRSRSIKVRQGDTVKAGTPLGLIGLSGMTEFPHLHFEVHIDGQHVDRPGKPGHRHLPAGTVSHIEVLHPRMLDHARADTGDMITGALGRQPGGMVAMPLS